MTMPAFPRAAAVAVFCAAPLLLGGCNTATHHAGVGVSSGMSTIVDANLPGRIARIPHAATTKKLVDDAKLQPGQCHERVLDGAAGLVLPDPVCNPGGVDAGVTQQNLQQTICVSGYTKTVRPSAYVTGKYKKQAMLAYSIPSSKSRTTEYDHIISLQLGGASDTRNLFPELNRDGAKGTTNPKDAVESDLNALVCQYAASKVTLVAAQEAIASNWTTALQQVGYEVRKKGSKTVLCRVGGSVCVPMRAADKD